MRVVLAGSRSKNHWLLVTAFWAEVILVTGLIGWKLPPAPPERASQAMPFFLISVVSAVAGFVVLFRLYGKREGLSPAMFQQQLLIGLAFLVLPTLLANFIIGSPRHEVMSTVLVAISAIGVPLAGYGNVAAYWKTNDSTP